MARIDRWSHELGPALRLRRPLLVAPPVGVVGDRRVERRRFVRRRWIPRQRNTQTRGVHGSGTTARRPVDPAPDATETTRTRLVRGSIPQALHRSITAHLVAVAVDQPVELAERHLPVATHDADQHSPQIDPDEHQGADRRWWQRSLVDAALSSHVAAMRLRPQTGSQGGQTVQHPPAAGGERLEFGVDRGQLLDLEPMGDPGDTEMIRPQPWFAGSDPGQQYGVEVSDGEHADDGTDACRQEFRSIALHCALWLSSSSVTPMPVIADRGRATTVCGR